MRHVPLTKLLKAISADAEGAKARRRLFAAHKKLAKMAPGDRQGYLDRNGSGKWSPLKNCLTKIWGNKCWYTEAELVGGPLTIDHYRPRCHYWWLAFDPDNFRVACPFANSPEPNPEHGCAGGKGDQFPLLGAGGPATGKNKLRREKPLILDPCKPEDCDLIAFHSDGRPVINPVYAGDIVATKRVEANKILLNLDHPAFNSKREDLYHDILDDVNAYEELPDGSHSREVICNRMRNRLLTKAPFSMAAKYYLQLYRHLDWVETLLQAPQEDLTCHHQPRHLESRFATRAAARL